MPEVEQDHIVFVMAIEERRFYRSVAAGQGRGEFESLMRRDSQWIEVDDSQWINRDHVLYAYLSRAGEDRVPLVDVD